MVTIQAMCLKYTVVEPSYYNCYNGKMVSITYSECVCVCVLSYPACKAHAPYYIFICSLSGFKYISTLSHKSHDLRKEKVIEHRACALIFSTTFSFRNISHSKKN